MMIKFNVLIALCFIFPQLYAQDDFDRNEIQNRIKPVGQVHVEQSSQTSQAAAAQPAAPVAEVKKSSGEDTFEHYCIVCHKDGLAGAPKFQNKDDWAPRLKGKTVDDLVGIAKNGLNAMPPKGTCSDCSDDDLKAAIQYMLPK